MYFAFLIIIWGISAFCAPCLRGTCAYPAGELFCQRSGLAQQFSDRILLDMTRQRCALHCLIDDLCASFTYHTSNYCLLHTRNQSSMSALVVDSRSAWYSPHNCILLSKSIFFNTCSIWRTGFMALD